MRARSASAGFTLIELVIVIMILGIVAGVLTPFIGQAVKAYQANTTRAELVTRGRLAMERLAREVRQAVPNTLRIVATGIDPDNPASTVRTGIEFVRAKGGGRYVEQGHPFGAAFSVLNNQFQSGTAMMNLYVIDPGGAAAVGDILVIGNTSPADVLAGSAVVVASVTATNPAVDNTDQGRVLGFDAPGPNFPRSSPARAYSLVDGTVGSVGTVEVGLHADASLRWHTDNGLNGYNNNRDWGGGDPMLVAGVERIDFIFAPGNPQSSAVLRVDLRLREGDETIRVYQEVHMRNTP